MTIWCESVLECDVLSRPVEILASKVERIVVYRSFTTSLLRKPSCECWRSMVPGGGVDASRPAAAPTDPFDCVKPPSTVHIAPFTKLAASDARNAYTFATSSGVPRRPNGTDVTSAFSIISLTAPVSLWVHAVSIGPGQIQFTRMPYFACTTAAPAVKALRKPFVPP